MQFLNFFLGLFALLPIATAHSRDFSPRAPGVFADPNCKAHGEICAEFMVGDKVHQQFRTDDNGCAPVWNPDTITAINVFDCWCGLWWATSTTECNNGGDQYIDGIDRCTGLVTSQQRGWKKMPTHWGCYRPYSG